MDEEHLVSKSAVFTYRMFTETLKCHVTLDWSYPCTATASQVEEVRLSRIALGFAFYPVAGVLEIAEFVLADIITDVLNAICSNRRHFSRTNVLDSFTQNTVIKRTRSISGRKPRENRSKSDR